MTLTLEQQFRQEQWRRWLMADGGCDAATATRLAQQLIQRAAEWGELDPDWGELEPMGADPFKEPAVARHDP